MPTAQKRRRRGAREDGTDEHFAFFEPMLAHKWIPGKHDAANDWLLSEKLDGMRALWLGDRFVTRTGKSIHAPAFFTAGLPRGLCLDGELFAGRGQFAMTTSIARSHNAGERWRQLSFVVFDAPTASGGFEQRMATARGRLSGGGGEPPVRHARVLEQSRCRDEAHLEAELERIEALGGEGLMMRKAGSEYEHGRSHELLKVKTFKDDEAIVTGHQAGKGKHKGRLGALECRARSGASFKVGTGFSDEQREQPPAIGTVITFRYFEITKKGVPRFPAYMRVRPDVDASEFE